MLLEMDLKALIKIVYDRSQIWVLYMFEFSET